MTSVLLTVFLLHATVIKQARKAVNDTDFTTLSEKIWAAGSKREDLVQRVANALREQILSAQLAPGVKLVPEAEFARNLGISRPSLREAIRILAHEGLIIVKHGVGTFVSKETKPMLGSLELMRSMTDLIRAAGGTPAHRDLKIELVEAPAAVSEALELERDTLVGRLTRVRLTDERPFVFGTEYVVLTPDRTFEALQGFTLGSLYQFLRETFGLTISHSKTRISAVSADSATAHLLDLRKGAPLMLMHELHYGYDGKPVLLTINYHNTEVVEFTSMRSGMPV